MEALTLWHREMYTTGDFTLNFFWPPEHKYEEALDETVSTLLGLQGTDNTFPNREANLQNLEEAVKSLLVMELSPELAKAWGAKYFVDLFKTYDSWRVWFNSWFHLNLI